MAITRMYGNMVASILLLIALKTIFVRGKLPDWIPPELMEMIADDKARCMEEHGTKQELIDAINDGQLPEDRSLTCYMYCLFDTFSVVDEDGNLEADVLVSFLPDDIQPKAAEVFSACAKPDGSDVCEKMLNIGKCVQSKDPKMFFMV